MAGSASCPPHSATTHTFKVRFFEPGRNLISATIPAVDVGLRPDEINEERLSAFMALAHAPDPDLFIRTGGELRISNFLLWQSAYTEFVFSDCLWPDFDGAELDAAIRSFAQRDRRFGGVKNTDPVASAC